MLLIGFACVFGYCDLTAVYLVLGLIYLLVCGFDCCFGFVLGRLRLCAVLLLVCLDYDCIAFAVLV